jgi:NADH-quinone oxidoreductase subunit M
MGLLSLAIWVPIAFGVALLAFGRDEQARRGVRWVALVGAIVSFLVTVPLYTGFQNGTAAMQFVEKGSWMRASTSTTTSVSTACRSGSCC